jgi:plasmid segregation protein ParM
MKNFNNTIIIGIDHGYGNIKTATCCFKTGVTAYDKEPTFKENLLIWQDRYYLIGEDHKEFSADKMHDMDYYVLTLAAIARELNTRKVTSATVHIAAGLPLTWVSEQKEEFKKYLLQNNTADFTFRDANYHIEFASADVFPQGFAAVADKLSDFKGINMLCDIGNGTMNVMYINDRKPIARKCFTEKLGTNQCLLAVNENIMRKHHAAVDDSIITRVLRFGTADIEEDYLKTITDTATEYVNGIFRKLREHEYHPKLMRLYVVGGGSCLVRNFGEFDKNRVMIDDDICATAKGYEYLAELNLKRNSGWV